MKRPRTSVKIAIAALLMAVFWLLAELLAWGILGFLKPPKLLPDGRRKVAPESVWKPRDAHKPKEKPWHRYRIVSIGDSCTYGLGVKKEAPYPRVLEQLLNQKAGFHRYEVLNLGVAGYTSYLGLTQLRKLALRFRPDLVIASFGLNDKWRSELSDRNKGALEHSSLMRLRFDIIGVLQYSPLFRLLRYSLGPLVKTQKMRFANLEAVYRVSLKEYEKNLAAIARECRANGAEVIFMFQLETPAIKRLTREGIAAHEAGDDRMAIQKLKEVTEIRFIYYPRPFWYLAQAYKAVGEKTKAKAARQKAEQFATLYPFPHPLAIPPDRIHVAENLDGIVLKPWDHFDIFGRYRETMEKVATAEKVNMLALDPRDFGPSLFFDYCHMTAAGYRRVAAKLLPLVWKLSRGQTVAKPAASLEDRDAANGGNP